MILIEHILFDFSQTSCFFRGSWRLCGLTNVLQYFEILRIVKNFTALNFLLHFRLILLFVIYTLVFVVLFLKFDFQLLIDFSGVDRFLLLSLFIVTLC